MALEGLRSHARERLGLHLNDERLEELERYAATRGSSPRSPDNELEDFLNGETYFFRYPFYLGLLKTRLLAGSGTFRVLCAACSTGEEAYSLAFALAGPARTAGRALEIVATDVRPKAVRAAREAVYGVWSLRSTPPKERSVCFDALPGNRFQVKEEFRSGVRFEVRNLLDPVEDAGFDAVVLCNATLYMHESAARIAYANVGANLRADGLLLISPTDPPPSAAAWRHCPEYGGWSVYRPARAEAAGREASAIAPAQLSASSPPAWPSELPIGPPPTPAVVRPPAVGRRRAARRSASLAEPRAAKGRASRVSLRSLQAADADLWTAWSGGRLASVEPTIRRKLFFEPEEPLWRFLHGVVLWEQRWLRRAQREIERAEQLLRALPENARVAGACNASELRKVIEEWRAQHG